MRLPRTTSVAGPLQRVGKPADAITRLSEEDRGRLRGVLQQIADGGADRVVVPAEARPA